MFNYIAARMLSILKQNKCGILSENYQPLNAHGEALVVCACPKSNNSIT